MLVLRPLFAAVVLSSLVAGPAAATTISFQNGFDGYSGADNQSFSFDATISQDRIRVDLPSDSHPDDRYAWVIFDGIVGDGVIPNGVTILSATFEGYVTNPFDSASITRLLDDIANHPYAPGSISDPGVAGSFYDDTQLVSASHGACVTPSRCSPPTYIAWDVTAIVQAWADGAPNYGFLLLPETTNGGNLATTDWADRRLRPRLVVEYDDGGISVPEPATAALLALASLGLAVRRRG